MLFYLMNYFAFFSLFINIIEIRSPVETLTKKKVLNDRFLDKNAY